MLAALKRKSGFSGCNVDRFISEAILNTVVTPTRYRSDLGPDRAIRARPVVGHLSGRTTQKDPEMKKNARTTRFEHLMCTDLPDYLPATLISWKITEVPPPSAILVMWPLLIRMC
jgi:hypothetical protein